VHVIPHGVLAPDDVEPDPEAWPRAAPGLRLLVLGRLERRKRPDLAVRALALLAARGRPDTLVVAGSGPLAPEAHRLADELGVAGRIAWVAAPDDDEKWRLLAAADVLLFPSVHEGFGLVPAEAQAVGTPVVAVAGTAVEEVVAHGESSLLVRPTPEAFAVAVERLADADERTAFGRRARAVARRFDWDVAAGRHAALLRRLAAG